MTLPGSDSVTAHDRREHYRCPMLGGPVPFAHCRATAEGRPCRQIVGCWRPIFDVQGFLDAHYDRAELEAAWAAAPRDKVLTLVELVRRARGQA